MTAGPDYRVLTPAGYAAEVSGGRYQIPPHIALLNRKLAALAAREIDRLIVTMPPRHGKSMTISQYFPAWWLGMYPDERVILASYEADFAATWGRKAQDVFSAHNGRLFGVELNPATTAAARWEVAGHEGGMTTAGVGGPITGKGADLLILDDLIKNAEEANSEVHRENIWEWLQSTAMTRLEPGGAVAFLMTRWHEDDPPGRLLAQMEAGGERWEVLNLPALAEEGDPLGRPVGAALWPERYDAEALGRIRRTIGDYHFESLYQGRPVPRKGGMFEADWFKDPWPAAPADCAWCRAWDLAASDGKGDWTVGVLMGRHDAGGPPTVDADGRIERGRVSSRYFVADVVRGRWNEARVDEVVRETALRDRERYGDVMVRGEQEPGASGKKAAAAFVRNLAGFDVQVEPNSGSKENRARALASQAGVGAVKLVRADWNAEFVRELARFPRGKHDDQVDAASLSFNTLALSDEPPGACASGGKVPSLVGSHFGLKSIG
jgi:predicted phage terminase large subunit-like protein